MLLYRDLLILMVVVWSVGRVFKCLKLPLVFGELLGGILVGPMLLGIVDPNSEVIRVLAELGIFFLMVHAGLKEDPEELLRSSGAAICIALGGMIIPFAAGFVVATAFGYSEVTALFIAVTLSISAIALAARLFKECNAEGSRAARLTLGAALVTDILALTLFSLVLNIADNGVLDLKEVAILLLKIVGFFSVVLWGGFRVAPFLRRTLAVGNKGFTLALILALILALLAEAMGLHAIIGAFLAGLFIREENIEQRAFAKIEDRFYGLSYSFFGPVFFASLAFHLDFAALSAMPIFLCVLTFVAVFGKVVGGGGTARLLGLTPAESLLVGFAMNSRGTVELVIASIGLQIGIINQGVFSALIIMAFASMIISLIAAPFCVRKKPSNHAYVPNQQEQRSIDVLSVLQTPRPSDDQSTNDERGQQ